MEIKIKQFIKKLIIFLEIMKLNVYVVRLNKNTIHKCFIFKILPLK